MGGGGEEGFNPSAAGNPEWLLSSQLCAFPTCRLPAGKGSSQNTAELLLRQPCEALLLPAPRCPQQAPSQPSAITCRSVFISDAPASTM